MRVGSVLLISERDSIEWYYDVMQLLGDTLVVFCCLFLLLATPVPVSCNVCWCSLGLAGLGVDDLGWDDLDAVLLGSDLVGLFVPKSGTEM